jgi:type IV pilus assembly protein PilM
VTVGNEPSIWNKPIAFRRKKGQPSQAFPEPQARWSAPAEPTPAPIPTRVEPAPDLGATLQIPAAQRPVAPPLAPAVQASALPVEEPVPAVSVEPMPFDLDAAPTPFTLAPAPGAAPPRETRVEPQPFPIGEPGPEVEGRRRGLALPDFGLSKQLRSLLPASSSRESAPRKYKSLVGLKIGGSSLYAAHIANSAEPRVLQVASDRLEPGTVVGGEVRNQDGLAEALKAFFARHKLPRSPVRLGIANNRIGVRLLELTGIDDPKQLGNAVRFRAQEVLPIALEEAVLDYRVLREEIGPDGERVHKVLLIVAHRELVEGYAAACQKAGLKLVGIDLEAFGLLRALTPRAGQVGSADDAALVVVSIGYDRSTLAVSDGRVCEFARVLEWGGSVLDAAVARALGITPAEAEAVRRLVTLLDGHAVPASSISPEDVSQARAAMRNELQAFGRELVASLRFYQEQPNSLGIGEIVLTGGCAEMEGLADELAQLVGVDVRVGDPLARVRLGRKMSKQRPSTSLTAAIGLGIED